MSAKLGLLNCLYFGETLPVKRRVSWISFCEKRGLYVRMSAPDCTPNDDEAEDIAALKVLCATLQRENASLRDRASRLREVTNTCQELEMEVNHWMEAHDAERARSDSLVVKLDDSSSHIAYLQELIVGLTEQEGIKNDAEDSEAFSDELRHRSRAVAVGVKRKRHLQMVVSWMTAVRKGSESHLMQKYFFRWNISTQLQKRKPA